jgi:hypothetical protein
MSLNVLIAETVAFLLRSAGDARQTTDVLDDSGRSRSAQPPPALQAHRRRPRLPDGRSHRAPAGVLTRKPSAPRMFIAAVVALARM